MPFRPLCAGFWVWLARSRRAGGSVQAQPRHTQAKEFAQAFELYRELAELGQPGAQENLAVMYVNGEGVPRDNVRDTHGRRSRRKMAAVNVQKIISSSSRT